MPKCLNDRQSGHPSLSECVPHGVCPARQRSRALVELVAVTAKLHDAAAQNIAAGVRGCRCWATVDSSAQKKEHHERMPPMGSVIAGAWSGCLNIGCRVYEYGRAWIRRAKSVSRSARALSVDQPLSPG
jgi:hypothetical protein